MGTGKWGQGTRLRSAHATFLIIFTIGFISPAALRGQAGAAASSKTGSSISSHDLSGVWVEKAGQSSSLLPSGQQEPPMTAWGKAQLKTAKAADPKKPGTGAIDPHSYCDPLGMPRADLTQQPIEIVQTSDEVYIFYEQDHSWRQVYMDGRAVPDAPDSSYLGYSVGKWDGDTLVVDTVGLNDKAWLDAAGHPHSDAMHVVERIRRTSPDSLQMSLTIEDPKAYTRTWTSVPRMFQLKRGYELTEDYCVAPDSLGPRKAASPSVSPDK